MSSGHRALAFSLVAHAVVLGGWLATKLAPAFGGRVEAVHRGAEVARKVGASLHEASSRERVRAEAAAARRELVERARADRRAGKLALGAFLVDASVIDALESGRALDRDDVRARYADRVQKLRDALQHGDLREAVPVVFADLRYFGRPGGLFADALTERGGSCEPIAQLVVAAAHDAGRGAEVALRYYGGDGTQRAHLAPIAVGDDGEEHDLATGRVAFGGGARVEAEELVEVYARAHDLAAKPPRAGSATEDSAESMGSHVQEDAPLPTMTAGYPPNHDRFPGGVPLFAARALVPSSEAQAGGAPDVDGSDMARDCAFYVRLAVLDPPSLGVRATRDDARVELRGAARATDIEREADWIRGVEDFAARHDSDDADKLMSDACIAALGDGAAADLALAGELGLADVAQRKANRARADGQALLARVASSPAAGATMRAHLVERYAGRSWLLLELRGGDDVVLATVRDAKKEDWGHVTALAALVVAPATRARAIALAAGLDPREQMDVMHEIFHAHERERAWPSNYALDDDPSGARPAGAAADDQFRRVYRVFRAMAFRLWQARRPVEETVAALDRDADREGIDTAFRVALLEYYGRNALAIGAEREGGLASARALGRALALRRHPALDLLARRVRDIVAKGRLDPETLADAWRIR